MLYCVVCFAVLCVAYIFSFFFFNDTATTEIYTLSLHDALPIFLPPIPPSIRVFSNESTLRMRWPKYWSFSFSIIPSKEIPGLISFRMDWLDLLESKRLSRVFSSITVQKHQFFSTQPSLGP